MGSGGKRSFLTGTLVGVVAAAAIAAVVVWLIRDPSNTGTPESQAVTPTPVSSPTPSPSDSAELADPQDALRIEAAFPEAVSGQRVRLGVFDINPARVHEAGPCRLHSFDGNDAYVTDCSNIEQNVEKDLIFVAVSLRNTRNRPFRFDIENFLLIGRDGRTFDPVDVRSDFDYAPFLLPRAGLIPPGKDRTGWLAFDGRVEDFVAEALSYIDGQQTLTVAFQGRHTVETV